MVAIIGPQTHREKEKEFMTALEAKGMLLDKLHGHEAFELAVSGLTVKITHADLKKLASKFMQGTITLVEENLASRSGKQRKLSAEARNRISEAQKKRWKKFRNDQAEKLQGKDRI